MLIAQSYFSGNKTSKKKTKADVTCLEKFPENLNQFLVRKCFSILASMLFGVFSINLSGFVGFFE